MDNVEKANLCERAAEEILKRGIAQKTYVDGTGAVCLVGAVSAALQNEQFNASTAYYDVHVAEDVLGLHGDMIFRKSDFEFYPHKQKAADFLMEKAKGWLNR